MRMRVGAEEMEHDRLEVGEVMSHINLNAKKTISGLTGMGTRIGIGTMGRARMKVDDDGICLTQLSSPWNWN
jgi:hypothetical protein